MELEELSVYQRSMKLGDRVWELVEEWSWFQKDTVGKQLVRAVDAIAASLSEGFGRFHFKPKLCNKKCDSTLNYCISSS